MSGQTLLWVYRPAELGNEARMMVWVGSWVGMCGWWLVGRSRWNFWDVAGCVEWWDVSVVVMLSDVQ